MRYAEGRAQIEIKYIKKLQNYFLISARKDLLCSRYDSELRGHSRVERVG